MADTAITPPTGSLGFSGQEVHFVNSGDMRLVFTGYAPTAILADTIISVPTGSLGFTGQLPQRPIGLQFEGYAPTLIRSTTILTGSIGFAGYAPLALIQAPPNIVAAPSTGSLGFTGYESGLLVESGELATASMSLTGQSLTATQTHPIYPFFDQLQITGYAPTIRIDNFGTMIHNLNAVTDVESNYQIDDRTGFKIKVKDPMMKEYTGHLVRPESLDIRSEQEYLRSKPERHRGPVRPEPVGSERWVEDEYPDGVDPDDL